MWVIQKFTWVSRKHYRRNFHILWLPRKGKHSLGLQWLKIAHRSSDENFISYQPHTPQQKIQFAYVEVRPVENILSPRNASKATCDYRSSFLLLRIKNFWMFLVNRTHFICCFFHRNNQVGSSSETVSYFVLPKLLQKLTILGLSHSVQLASDYDILTQLQKCGNLKCLNHGIR